MHCRSFDPGPAHQHLDHVVAAVPWRVVPVIVVTAPDAGLPARLARTRGRVGAASAPVAVRDRQPVMTVESLGIPRGIPAELLF